VKFFKENKDLFLIKLFSVNSIGVVLRSILGLISQKLIAIYLGPNGMALLGNLKNALALFGLVSTTGIDQGVLKYQSEFENKPEVLNKLYSTSAAYALVGSVAVFCGLFFAADYFSLYLFNSTKYAYLFIILSFTMPFMAFFNLCFAVVNGKSNYKKATLISFTSYTLITAVVISLVLIYGLSGALLAITLTPIAHIVALFIFAKKEILLFFKVKIKFHSFFKDKLYQYIIMAIAAVVLSNIVDLQLRNYLIQKLSVAEAGYWTSMTSLSNYYLSFLTGVYSLYVLPKYAKINSLKGFKVELLQIYKVIVPIFAMMFLGIYFFRVFIIQMLFTDDFLPMQNLFKWQLLGDLVKIVSVVIAYQFIAKKMWKLYILTEAISYIILYIFGVYFVNLMGVEGIVFAHFLRYIIYLLMVLLLIPSIFKKKI